MISSRIVYVLSALLVAMIITCSVIGLFSPDFYEYETLNWQAQSIGQDLVNLAVIVPALIFTSVLAAGSNEKSAFLLWGGVLLYLIYTFTIYCFAVHFNQLFLVYCLTLGLAFYSFLYLLYKAVKNHVIPVITQGGLIRSIGIYFIAISILFWLLWLSGIIPSLLAGVVPEDLREYGLFTNPVHVIDLAVFLPGLFMCGILVLKRRSLGFLLAPVMLMFFTLMDITIAGLIFIMKHRGLEANVTVAVAMIILALLSVAILIRYLQEARYPPMK